MREGEQPTRPNRIKPPKPFKEMTAQEYRAWRSSATGGLGVG